MNNYREERKRRVSTPAGRSPSSSPASRSISASPSPTVLPINDPLGDLVPNVNDDPLDNLVPNYNDPEDNFVPNENNDPEDIEKEPSPINLENDEDSQSNGSIDSVSTRKQQNNLKPGCDLNQSSSKNCIENCLNCSRMEKKIDDLSSLVKTLLKEVVTIKMCLKKNEHKQITKIKKSITKEEFLEFESNLKTDETLQEKLVSRSS